MQMKKIIAGIVASALVVTSIAITNVFADDKTEKSSVASPASIPIASPNGEWTETKLVDNSSAEMEGIDLIGVDKVIFNAVAWDINYGWNNGAFYLNSNGSGYQFAKFGGSNAGDDVVVLLEKPGKFSVEVEIGITDGWFEIGCATSTAEGAFELESIEFYKGSEKVGTWADKQFTAAADEGPILENIPIASPDGEWTETKLVASSSAEMKGKDVIGVDKVIFNAVAWDINYGWNNGAFYTNSNGANYQFAKFGGSNSGDVAVLLEKVGKFSVELEIGITDGWFEIGCATSTAEGAFELESIEFYKGSEKVGTWADSTFIATKVPATGVTLNKETLTLEKGDTFTLEATVAPENSTDKVVWSSDNEDVATVDENGEVTAVDGGTATITATAGEVSATCEVTVTVSATGVTLNKTTLTLEKGNTFTLEATVAPENSTDKVAWSSSDEKVATVDQNGKVTAKGAGKAEITATAGEVSATCEVTVTVPATGVTLNETTLTLEKGKTETLTATVAPTDSTDKVVWSSSDEEVATVDQNGKVTAVAKGTATIKATAGKASASCEVTVTVPVTSVTLDKNELELKKDGTAVLTATVNPADATDKTVTWTSDNEAAATVDENGKVTAVASGTAVITAAAGGKTAECTVTVTNPAEKIEIDDITVLTRNEKEIVIKITPADADSIGTVTYESADETVAKVVDGKVLGVKAGTTTITATAGNLTAEFKVTVTDEEKPATEITLDKTSLSLEKGKSDILTATVEPKDSTDKIVWSSDNEAVATVDQSGKVTAIGGGKAVITATAGSVSATCEITVTVPVTSVTLDKNELSLEKNESAVLTATVDPDDATDKTVTWESSDETVATVDENGKVIAVGGGTATITAKAGNKSAACEVTVTVPVTSVTLDKNELSLEKNESAVLTATVDPDDATDKTVTWESSDETVATVDQNGKVTAIGGGKAVITAKAGNKSAACEVTVTVPVTGVTLDKNELSLEKGESAELTATVAPEDATDKTVTWTSSDEKVATVDENGKVTAIAAGTATITAKVGDMTATCTVTVTLPVTGITLDKNELSLEKGESAELTATVEPEDATDKTVTWTSSDEKVATVDENGKVTAIAAGTATITAKAGDMTATCTVTVTEKAEDTEPEDTKPEDTEPEDTKPEDTKPEDTKPDVTEPDVTEPDTSNDGKDDENNKPTGVAIALVPAVAAAAAAMIFKKRK